MYTIAASASLNWIIFLSSRLRKCQTCSRSRSLYWVGRCRKVLVVNAAYTVKEARRMCGSSKETCTCTVCAQTRGIEELLLLVRHISDQYHSVAQPYMLYHMLWVCEWTHNHPSLLPKWPSRPGTLEKRHLSLSYSDFDHLPNHVLKKGFSNPNRLRFFTPVNNTEALVFIEFEKKFTPRRALT